jgi:hypothetical protein
MRALLLAFVSLVSISVAADAATCIRLKLSITQKSLPLPPGAVFKIYNDGPGDIDLVSTPAGLEMPFFAGSSTYFFGDNRYVYSIVLLKKQRATVRVCR